MLLKSVVYPGTFDPITNGHIDIIKKASKIFNKVIVAIYSNDHKKPMFNIDKRVNLAKKSTYNIKNLKVLSFNGLLIDFMKKNNSTIIVRGLRDTSDFNYEIKLARMNTNLMSTLETVFLIPSLETSFISSSLIKNIFNFKYKKDLKKLVPLIVYKTIIKKQKNYF